jgi:hypothetical protein
VEVLQLLQLLLAHRHRVRLVQGQRRHVLPHHQLVQLAVRGEDDAPPLRRVDAGRLHLDAVGEEGAGKRRERVQLCRRLLEQTPQPLGQAVQGGVGFGLVL